MATLAPGGRITRPVLAAEISRLETAWHTPPSANSDDALISAVIGAAAAADLDLFDRAQLACVLPVCRMSASLSEAGRRLFAVTRGKRSVTNDADRLRKYLARFRLTWIACSGKESPADSSKS